MIVFSNADGTIVDVVSTPVYQGSNLSGSMYFVAPIPRSNAVTVSFKLPNGLYSDVYTMIGVVELEGVTDKLGKQYSVWEWQDKNAEVTAYVGVCVAQFCIYLPDGQLLTTSHTSFNVQQGVLRELPPAPADDVYEQILRYLGRVQGSLVTSVEKVPHADNAIRYVDNFGVVSAPIVIGSGEDSPIPITAANVIEIPQGAWKETDNGYTCTLTAGMHGQMRDDVDAKDLWVSFERPNGDAFTGSYEDYSIDENGNITITAATNDPLIVKVWNGNNLADTTARADIVAETERAEREEQEIRASIAEEVARAESAEEGLQTQISELQNTGVDTTARADIEKLTDDITLTEDLTLAGNYTQVGNISKDSETATTTYPAKGKTVKQLLQEIFAKTLQPRPDQIMQPRVTGFSFNYANRSVEVGTKVNSVYVGTLGLNPGAYPYDTETGVEATGYSIKRKYGSEEVEISTSQSATDNNDGDGFVIGDNVTLSYKGAITYSEGNIASDNMGAPSDPPVRIEAGTATSVTGALSGYRNYFYGTTNIESPPKGDAINSGFIRELTMSGKAYAPTTFEMVLPAGTTAVYIACLATRTGVTRVFNENNQQDITSAFVDDKVPTPITVNVEGADGYNAAAYKVFYYVPSAAFLNDVRLTITLG